MASSSSEDIRVSRLTKLFKDVINGRRNMTTSRDGKLFIEGLCVQTDPATTAHQLISTPSGLFSLQAAVRFDTSLSFQNESATLLICYLQSTSLRSINSGFVLKMILLNIVEPPFFWEAFTKSFLEGLLSVDASRCFAWLLLQLITLPGGTPPAYLALAASPNVMSTMLKAADGEVRNTGQKIKHCLPLPAVELQQDAEAKPGGRHDNDHEDYRKISIMPTTDELISKELPFLRTAIYMDHQSLTTSNHIDGIHLDNQFRLLREDMVHEIRSEIKILTSAQLGRHKGLTLESLTLSEVNTGEERKRHPWGVVLKCCAGLPQLAKQQSEKRVKYLKDHRQILPHGNMACLLVDDEPVEFPTIHRNETELSQSPALVTVQFQDDSRLRYTLPKMKTAENIKLVQLDTAVFAFHPFLLRLQEMRSVPLSEELVHWKEEDILLGPSFQPSTIISSIERRTGKDLKDLLGVKKTVILDSSQMRSLCSCLRQRVSLVQGPPGTGKSFIGALVANTLYKSTKETILVVCFTNHALDQFLEDLLDIGIPAFEMVRLGGQSTDRTKPLMLRNQASAKLDASQWTQIDKLKRKLETQESRLKDAFKRFKNASLQKDQLLDYLEFLDEDLPYFDAFNISNVTEGEMTYVGRRNKRMNRFYLLDRWIRGVDAGPLKDQVPEGTSPIWEMRPEQRHTAINRWRKAILDDLANEITNTGREFNLNQMELGLIFAERDAGVIRSKRIIACTTNGAAKFTSAIQSASPGVVLVEEAGEILESHILTSMGPHTQQLIMIRDHKQLRPKCSYELSVEQGDGFDLNRSLFERLVAKGFPHVTLSQQHRMRPQISSLIRHLTYPDLTDAPSTFNRPDLRGFQDNVIFINHTHPEVELTRAVERRDGRSSSKQNDFESQMILKCVRYLAQQGYGSDQIVVLTPYLGQLTLLRDQLSIENDPILNDLDRYDLISAGLLLDSNFKASKPSLRLSTIDNYQGEESDIVLVSLTRCNTSHDIGFMAAPERLNVLLSRARDALIMVGSMETFLHARKGSAIWENLFQQFTQDGHIYKGFPVKCQQHPTRLATLSSPDHFAVHCPDGGCREPCEVLLSCGIHKCPSSCHQLMDHSRKQCTVAIKRTCSKGHSQIWQCHSGAPLTCFKCEQQQKQAMKKAQQIAEQQIKRDETIQQHLREVAKLEDEIHTISQKMKDDSLLLEHKNALAQKRKDLAAAKTLASKRQSIQLSDSEESDSTGEVVPSVKQNLPSTSKQRHSSPSTPTMVTKKLSKTITKSARKPHADSKINIDPGKSVSRLEWQRQKGQEGACNPAIDAIMDMIGLEDIKSQVLRIKSKVDTSVRQGVDLKRERLGLVLLGNPGTGKTTVARYYAKVLTSLQVLPGTGFIETTGSRLAHGGVAEVKNHFQELENSEGGVYFIDEAYQLTEGHNHGGKPVLDFLLAEIENLTGKVVFIFAGYRKQMEKFFEHNPGLASRIPYTLRFDDYTDTELLAMLKFQMLRHFKSGIEIEEGADGLYMRIAVRRLGRGRGQDGFGNARALENLFSQIRERQSDRLARQRKEGLSPDDFYLVREDLIGPDPSEAILNCESWTKLQQLTGLQAVKKSVKYLIDLISVNYMRELKEEGPIQASLNRVFLGNPGTGKTTVAKLYGRILAEVGVLSNGEVVVKNPSDFIGSFIGQSEANTKAILSTTVGKVLIIDEAYMLSSGSGSGGTTGVDAFKNAVIDTIVAEVQNVPGDDRCVLLLGYEPQMIEMFQNVNPGLTRRFQLSEAFRFDDFSDVELEEILRLKLKQQDLGATSDAVTTAIEILSKARMGLNFGNGGDVENLISKAKASFQIRQSLLPISERSTDFTFEPQDFDPNHDRAKRSESNLQLLFKDVIGCENVVQTLQQYLQVAKGMKASGRDPRGHIGMNFLFLGPPGTGKTTTARKFGQFYYDLGFLSQIDVVECSASDLIGQYIGHTAPKVLKQLERGLGKVLFIDEAYRLGEGHFAQEAVNELVDSMTKPKFAGKMVIILAGYDNDMKRLLQVNQGLSSRFTDEIIFRSLTPVECCQLLEANLKENQIKTPLAWQDSVGFNEIREGVTELSQLPAWGNARDIGTLATKMIQSLYSGNTTKNEHLSISLEMMLVCVTKMLVERRSRANTKAPALLPEFNLAQGLPNSQVPPSFNAEAATKSKKENGHFTPPKMDIRDKSEARRDSNVSDTIWNQLQQDRSLAQKRKTTESEQQKVFDKLHQESEQAIQEESLLRARQQCEDTKFVKAQYQTRQEEEARVRLILENHQMEKSKREAEATALRETMERQLDDARRELMRQREQERLQRLREKDLRDRMRREAEKKLEETLERMRQDQMAQKKLREMGVCVAGFQWIKQAGGYRCEGGAHFVSDDQLWM